MILTDILSVLQDFGLTQYEAKAFLALVRLGSASGYQVSKLSGIPRARIYDTLDSLVNRGLAMTEDKNDSKTFQALPVDVFLEKQKKQWEHSYETAKHSLKQLEASQPKQEVYVNTIKGQESILSLSRSLLSNASKQILLSMWKPMYDELLPDLQKKQESGCTIRGIVFDVEDPLSGLFTHRKNDYMKSIENKWFILSVDSQKLLYGHSVEQNGNAFYTDDPVHLFLLEDYIWHDVLVNQLVSKGDQEQLDQWILPEMEHFFGQKMLPDSFWAKKKD